MKIQIAAPVTPAAVRACATCTRPMTIRATGQNWRKSLARRICRLSSVNNTPTMAIAMPRTSCPVILKPVRGSICLFHSLMYARTTPEDFLPHHGDADGDDKQRPRLLESQHARLVQQQQHADEQHPDTVAPAVVARKREPDRTDGDEDARPEGAPAEPDEDAGPVQQQADAECHDQQTDD